MSNEELIGQIADEVQAGIAKIDNTIDLSAIHAGAVLGMTALLERLERVPSEVEVANKAAEIKAVYEGKYAETQQYKSLGNGWTIDVIAYLLSYLT